MSRGTLVVEAPEKSGALITARFALEQDRDLWVASSGIIGEKGAGTAKLAEDGARVVSSAWDILKEWGFAAQRGEERETEFSPAGLAEELAWSLGIG
jgi:DNA processing protein